MKIFGSAATLTLSLSLVVPIGIATSASAEQSRISLSESSAQPTPEPVIIPVPAPRPSATPTTEPSDPASRPSPPPPSASTSNIVALAREWKGTPYRYAGKSRSGIDCSHFVHTIYSQAVPGFGYRMAREYLNDSKFSAVSNPQPGDIIVFPSYRGSSDHVGIVTDAQAKMFIGAQTSTGVAETSYGPRTYYWGKRPYKILRMK
jgi:cell wall-associated NlpC family hydrolase